MSARDAEQAAAEQTQVQLESQGAQGAARPTNVLPTMLNRIAENIPGPICDNFLAEPARAAFVASTGQPDCASAVARLASQVIDRNAYASAKAPISTGDDGAVVNACAMTWSAGTAAGPQVGRLTVGRKEGGTTYVVTAFAPC